MKSEIKFSIAISLFSLLFFASSANATYVSLVFSSSSTPTTIEPGTNANLLLTISNAGTDFAKNVKLMLKSTPGIIPNIGFFDLGIINAGGSTQVVIPITISPSAPEGTVALPFTVSYDTGSGIGSASSDNSATIVITKRTIIQITDVEYDEAVIQRGDNIKMIVTIQNVGSGSLRNLLISLRNFTLAVVPASTDTEKFVGALSPNEETSITFDLIVSTSSDTITYSIPVLISYYDEQGIIHSDTKYVGLKISGIPDFVVSIEKADNVFAGTTGTLTISIANIGTGSAKFVTAYATADDGDVVPGTTYVGNLDPDDTNTLTIDVNPVTAGRHSITLHLEYKDSYNQVFSKAYPLEFDVGRRLIGIPLEYEVVIIIIILAVLYWKRNSIRRLIKRK